MFKNFNAKLKYLKLTRLIYFLANVQNSLKFNNISTPFLDLQLKVITDKILRIFLNAK